MVRGKISIAIWLHAKETPDYRAFLSSIITTTKKLPAIGRSSSRERRGSLRDLTAPGAL